MDYNLGTARGVIEVGYDGRGVTQAEQGLAGVKTKSGDTQKALDKSAKAMGLAGGVIAAGLGLAVRSASNFETVISGIGAVTGANGKELDSLRNKALQLGKDTQYSAGQAAQAIEELAKAGLSIPDILNGAADATVNLAAAGGIALPEAATIAANAMNAFSLKAKDMPHIADLISGAANASAIDVSQFGLSLSQSGAAANLAGLSFDDLSVAIAEMGNAGIKGSDAGTSLKSFLLNLIPTTNAQTSLMMELGLMTVDTATAMSKLAKEGIKPVSTAFPDIIDAIEKYNAANGGAKEGTVKAQKEALKLAQSMGVVRNQFFDAEGKTKSLREIQDLLATSTKNLTKEQKLSALQTLFGSDAIRSASILAQNGAAGYDKLAAGINKVKAADVAKKRMDNLHGSMEILKGSVETLAIALGEILLPIINSIVKTMTTVVNFFLTLPGPVQKAVVAFLAIAAAALLMAAATIKVVKFAQEVKKTMLILKELQAVSKLGFLAGPWGLAILAIIVVIILLIKYHKQIFAVVKKVWGAIADFMKSVWSAISGAAKAIWGGIVGFFSGIWNAIYAVIKLYLTIVATIIRTYITIWITIITTALNIIKGIWEAVWGVFGGIISAVFGLIVAIIKLNLTIIAAVFYAAFLGIKLVVETFMKGVQIVISAVLSVIKTIWGVFWRLFGGPITTALNAIKVVITTVFNIYKTIITTVLGVIKTVVSTVWDAIRSIISGAVDKIKTAIGFLSSIASTIRGFFSAAYDAVVERVGVLVSFVGGIGGKIIRALGDVGKLLYEAGKKIIQGLIDGIESMIKKVTDTINKVTDKIGSFLPGSPVREGPLKVLNQGYAGKQIVNMLTDGIALNAPKVEMAMNAAVSGVIPTPRTFPTPAAATVTSGGGATIEFNVFNPVAETASDTGARRLRSLAALGVL